MSESLAETNISSAHFIGIGGAGMSGIALVLYERGCRVTGSDLKNSHYVRELESAGIDVTIGHEASTIDGVMPDVVVTSTAIPDSNPEVVRAPSSWGFPSGPGRRCSRTSRSTPSRWPSPAPMARRPPRP